MYVWESCPSLAASPVEDDTCITYFEDGSYIKVTVYNSNWYTVSKTTTRSGNTATGVLTMGKKVLGITISQPTYTTTLTCDRNGNLP